MSNQSLRYCGFTLVEIMIVVGIVGILAGIAIPTFMGVRNSARATRMLNDFRNYGTAFEMHAFEMGYWPEDVNRGTVPPGMESYLKGDKFTGTSPIGGQWDWDFDTLGIYAGVSVVDHTTGDRVLQKIDEAADDGNLDTGQFRRTASGRYTYVLEEY